MIAAAILSTIVAWGQYARTITFSGYDWSVKVSTGRVGPGPNYFSDGTNNVWVDPQGRLHLKITNAKGKWYCAEVVSKPSFGYGTYRWYLDTPVDNLDPNVVLGVFTWSDLPDYNHREIDIEFSRWGSVNNQNAQYVVQPYTNPGNIVRWDEPPGLSQTNHGFNWQSGSIFFQSLNGPNTIQQWTFNGPGIPMPGGENARMNLWLVNGRAPTNRQPVEIIINRFEFVP